MLIDLPSHKDSDSRERKIQMSCAEGGCNEKAFLPPDLINRVLFGRNCALVEAVPLVNIECPRKDCGATPMQVTTTNPETIVRLRKQVDPTIIEEDPDFYALPSSHLRIDQPATAPSGDEGRHLSLVPSLHPEQS